jgi:hypothetical protein
MCYGHRAEGGGGGFEIVFCVGVVEQGVAGGRGVVDSNGNDIDTKEDRSFDLDFVFNIEAKRTCLFQNL